MKSEKQKVMVSLCRVTLAEAHRPAARSDERGGRARTLTVSVTYSCFSKGGGIGRWRRVASRASAALGPRAHVRDPPVSLLLPQVSDTGCARMSALGAEVRMQGLSPRPLQCPVPSRLHESHTPKPFPNRPGLQCVSRREWTLGVNGTIQPFPCAVFRTVDERPSAMQAPEVARVHPPTSALGVGQRVTWADHQREPAAR